MLLTSIIPGNPVRVACDMTSAQIAACAYALGVDRDRRYRNVEMSVDDVLAMRDLTAMIDRFAQLAGHGAHDTVQLTVAQLVALRDALRDLVTSAGETDAVTQETRGHLPAAAALVDPLAELAEAALQVALGELAPVEIDDSDFDSLLGG